jgi:protein O-GlcNAc transferase
MLRRLLEQLFNRPRSKTAAVVPTDQSDTPPASPQGVEQRANRLQLDGDLAGAIEAYLEGINAFSHNAPLRFNAALALKEAGRIPEAIEQLETAVGHAPGLVEAWLELGKLLNNTQWVTEARHAFEKTVALSRGTSKTTLLNYAAMGIGLCLQKEGRYKEARDYLERCAIEFPEIAEISRQNALFTWIEDPEASPQAILAAHRAWDQQYLANYPRMPHANDPEPERRLKIGYVSGDLRGHAVAWFFEHLLEFHDRAPFDITCYDNTRTPDAVSQRLRDWGHDWREVAQQTSESIAGQIAADGIDILFDLSGHTAHNLAPVFARKPAPIQITWLGYRVTTGMDCIDFRLTDAFVDPPGRSESGYSERLLRMPQSQWAYRQPSPAPTISALPMERNGFVTFGSFNQFDKLSPLTLKTWAAILRELPQARLLMLGIPQGECRLEFLARWRDLGVNPERLELHANLPREQYHATIMRADIALDPFPYNGGTSTCEVLWMGVPVVALAGNTGLARAGVSILNAARLPDWIASSMDDYVTLAVERARDPRGLATLRAGLRAHLLATPLLDGRTFTRDLETLLRGVWREWCARHQ